MYRTVIFALHNGDIPTKRITATEETSVYRMNKIFFLLTDRLPISCKTQKYKVGSFLGVDFKNTFGLLVSETQCKASVPALPRVSAEIHRLPGEERTWRRLLNGGIILWVLLSSLQAVEDELFLGSMMGYVTRTVWCRTEVTCATAQRLPRCRLHGRAAGSRWDWKAGLNRAGC